MYPDGRCCARLCCLEEHKKGKLKASAIRHLRLNELSMIILWIVSTILVALSFYVIVGNLWITFGGLINKRKKPESLIPWIGGLLGLCGLLVMPLNGASTYLWIPLTADLGCGLLLLVVVFEQIKKNSAYFYQLSQPKTKVAVNSRCRESRNAIRRHLS
jgi:hypothetical protein